MKGITFQSLIFITFVSFWGEVCAQSSPSLIGFTDSRSQEQISLEKQFDAGLRTEDMDNWMRRIAAHPHHVGSSYGKANALFIDSLFGEWGFQTRIDTYYVLFPTPEIRELEMIDPKTYKAELIEKPLSEDSYTAQTEKQLPPYNAYSADGEVTADLVYVNYGLPEDYEKLAEMGISVEGKIVIARYGRSWRGVKPKVAYEHGAIGCIIYSDPKDDGYYKGETYPEGAYKNPSAVQRGSVLNAPVRAGDPLTPGYPATKHAKRLKISEAKTIKKIPVLPIGYGDAQPLLAHLKGPVAPGSWRGALPITYHIGPGPAKVHLKLKFNWDIKPIHNVIATLQGSEYPDQWIIRGNHHDAWVNGAADPVSGLVAMLAEAKSVSMLVRQGWKPNRTIMYCAWDGEEPMLLGSTEFTEDYAEELKKKAVAYINTDNNGRGVLQVSGAKTLRDFFLQIPFSIQDPEAHISVGQRRLYQLTLSSNKWRNTIPYGGLGSGSDYTPFFQHLGIPSISFRFRGEDGGGEYHTMYDTYEFFKRFKDPGFKYGKAMAQVGGRTVLRLANADILPFKFQYLYKRINSYAGSVKNLANKLRKQAGFHNELLQEKVYELGRNRTKKFVSPSLKKEVPRFDFQPLQEALTHFKKSTKSYDSTLEVLMGESGKTRKSKIRIEKLNKKVYGYLRKLSDGKGLPGQEWYKNLIFAPGLYTGYGVKTLPGIRQAIELGNFEIVDSEIIRLGNALENCSNYIDKMVQYEK